MSIKRYISPITLGGTLIVALASAILIAAFAVPVGPAFAQNTTSVQSSLRNERLVSSVDASAVPQNFATTSYADLTGASVTFIPQVDPTVPAYYGGPNRTDLIRAYFTADVTKATATTGNCALYVNGAILAKTARYIASAAGRGTLSFDYVVPNTSASSQTVKVQCQSADTNALTVTNANLVVMERW